MKSTSDDKVDIRFFDGRTAEQRVPDVARVYEAVYREPPYLEGPTDVTDFVAGMPRRMSQPAFRMATAEVDDEVVGFAFGHQLTADTKWWAGAIDRIPDSLTDESSGRTFAIIELAVTEPYRRRGIARALHHALICAAPEQRVTLLVRPEAKPAKAAYISWGYAKVGTVQPWPTAPIYDAMILDLHAHSRQNGERNSA